MPKPIDDAYRANFARIRAIQEAHMVKANETNALLDWVGRHISADNLLISTVFQEDVDALYLPLLDAAREAQGATATAAIAASDVASGVIVDG